MRASRDWRREAIGMVAGFPLLIAARKAFEAVEADIARDVRDGHHGYTPATGIKPLREAISEHTAKLRGVRYDVDREIIVTVGVSEPSMKRSASTSIRAKLFPILDPGASSLFCAS